VRGNLSLRQRPAEVAQAAVLHRVGPVDLPHQIRIPEPAAFRIEVDGLGSIWRISLGRNLQNETNYYRVVQLVDSIDKSQSNLIDRSVCYVDIFWFYVKLSKPYD
jgi:hypothetical protein